MMPFERQDRGWSGSRNQRIRAGALAVFVVIVVIVTVALARAFNRADRTADELHPPSFTGTVITYTNGDPRGWGDLVATHPDTGEVRTIVDAHSVDSEFRNGLIYNAASSVDGRWVAFDIAGCGLWVTNGLDEPRRLAATPCTRAGDLGESMWEWSPAGAQLIVVLRSLDDDALVLIDAATGDRTALGEVSGEVTSLAWSPDGTRIAYGAVPRGTGDGYSRGSMHSMSLTGVDSVLTRSLGRVSGGETGSGIRWSPDGSRIAVLTEADPNRLLLMNADGSDLELLTEGVVIAHILGSPNLTWSPDGTRMAYATLSERRDEWRFRIWNASPDDGSTPILVSESPRVSERGVWLSGGPVWSPDGTRIAFRYSPTGNERGSVMLVANADGAGEAREIDELTYRAWRGGWYFCECYG